MFPHSRMSAPMTPPQQLPVGPCVENNADTQTERIANVEPLGQTPATVMVTEQANPLQHSSRAPLRTRWALVKESGLIWVKNSYNAMVQSTTKVLHMALRKVEARTERWASNKRLLALGLVGALGIGILLPFAIVHALSSKPKYALSSYFELPPMPVGSLSVRSTALSANAPFERKNSTSQLAIATPGSIAPGLDFRAIAVDDFGVTAQTSAGHMARLTLNAQVQQAASRLLTKHKLPHAAIVALEPQTGKILVYTSKSVDGRDLITDATAPSASVFKVITATALVQHVGLSAETKQCYSGGEQRLVASDLKDDFRRDKYCATLAQAMGRSINTVFARLAARNLKPNQLLQTANSFGYGQSIPFDFPVATSKIDIPDDTLGFARTSAGFYHSTMSPLHGALIAAAIANKGTIMKPFMIQEVRRGQQLVSQAPQPAVWAQATDAQTAKSVERMMMETVSQGTSFKAFHDLKGKSFLPGIGVAGKTGTLNLHPSRDKTDSPNKLVTWFVGYAPVKQPKIAIATLVVNDPVWKIKANTLAREVLQAYFALAGSEGVRSPNLD